MPLERFIPKSPDPFIRNSQDFEVAKFGHLNTIIEYVNTYVAADSLQLAGTGPLTSTARYITDSLGNTSTLAISTVNIGIGTSTPAGKVDIVSDGGGQLLFSRYGGQPQIIIRRSQGTFAAPTAVTGGASSVLAFQNYDGTSFGTSAQIQSVPTENQTPTAKGASLALNVVQAGTTSVINGLIVSGATTTPGSVSITTNFSAAAARLSIWQTALSSTLPYFNIQEIGGGKLLEFSNAGNLLVGSGSPSDTAKVSIKGSGSTSATTSLLVQNSAGTTVLQVADDGNTSFSPAAGGTVQIGSSTTSLFRIVNTYQRISVQPVSIGGSITLAAGTEAGASYTANDSGHVFAYPFNRTTANTFTINREFFGNVVTGTKTMLNITTSNITGLSNATTLRGIYFAPTITDWGSVVAFESTAGNVIFNGGNVGIGTSSPTSTLQVNGTASVNGQFDVINGSANFRVTNESTSYVALKYGISPWLAYNGSETYFQGTQFYYQSGANFRFAGSGSFGFTSNPSARLHIQGSGSTSATTSLLVQNSAGTELLKVIDSNSTFISNTVSINQSAPSVNAMTVQHQGAWNGTVGLFARSAIAIYAQSSLGADAGNPDGASIVAIGGAQAGYKSVGLRSNRAIISAGSAVNIVDSAMLQVDSTTQGFLPPRMTTAQRTAIVLPAAGLIVYDTDTNKSYTYDGTAWQAHW